MRSEHMITLLSDGVRSGPICGLMEMLETFIEWQRN